MKGAVSREELEALVVEIHHVREEHRRAHEGGTTRRHLGSRVLELEADFERLLAEWVPRAEVREAWHSHLYGAAPEPAEPAPAWPLAYRGRSEAGSQVEIRRRADASYDVRVDGSLVEIVEAELDFAGTTLPHTFDLDDQSFRETFAVSAEAAAALEEFVAGSGPRPPWRYAAELVSEGLVDRNFALTPRGHRALAAIARRETAAPVRG